MAENPCLQELNVLQSMDESLKAIANISNQNAVYTHGDWTARRKGRSVVYELQFDYAGATKTVNLDFLTAAAVNRIEQIWNDGTAKDLSVRLYSNGASSLYSELNKKTANTDTSIINTPTSDNELKFPAAGRLQFYYANFTVGKTCKIVVAVDEI